MTSIEEDIISHFTANPILSPLIGGNRLYTRMPDSPVFPLVVYSVVSAARTRDHDGDASVARPRIQFTTFGKNKFDVINVTAGVMVAANTFPGGGAEIYGPMDAPYNATTKLFQRMCDVLLWDTYPLPS